MGVGAETELGRGVVSVRAPDDQRADVAALSSALDGLAAKEDSTPCRLLAPDGGALDIPRSVLQVLARVSELMARGDAVTVVPVSQ